MKCVLITGAGVSRDLGRSKSLPLMGDWANALRVELNGRERGLAAAIGLVEGMSGEEFEETLGALLRWQDLRALNERFWSLGSEPIGKATTDVVRVYKRQDKRLDTIMAGINFSLFRSFGTEAIDRSAAASAYRLLLEALGDPDDLVVVTTNYDPAAENALSDLARPPDTGFDRPPGRAPTLNPQGMVARSQGDPRAVAVLHLHGAVGWYEQDGIVREQHQNLDYNATLGRPVVLYPDPDKDPTRDAVVQALWDEFDAALEEATHVIVIGHSLRDRALVGKLRTAAENAQIAVCICVMPGDQHSGEAPLVMDTAEWERATELLPASTTFLPARFGPSKHSVLMPVAEWVGLAAKGRAAMPSSA